MKIYRNIAPAVISLLLIAQGVTAIELDNSKIYRCQGQINGKEENILYDARVVPERECQTAAQIAAGLAKNSGQAINYEDIKKSCIDDYNTDKAKVLKLNTQGKCKIVQPKQGIFK